MCLDYEPDDLDVTISELLVATSDSADPDLPPSVPEVLKLLRTRLGMDCAFVSQIDPRQGCFSMISKSLFIPKLVAQPLAAMENPALLSVSPKPCAVPVLSGHRT